MRLKFIFFINLIFLSAFSQSKNVQIKIHNNFIKKDTLNLLVVEVINNSDQPILFPMDKESVGIYTGEKDIVYNNYLTSIIPFINCIDTLSKKQKVCIGEYPLDLNLDYIDFKNKEYETKKEKVLIFWKRKGVKLSEKELLDLDFIFENLNFIHAKESMFYYLPLDLRSFDIKYDIGDFNQGVFIYNKNHIFNFQLNLDSSYLSRFSKVLEDKKMIKFPIYSEKVTSNYVGIE
mgnify:CR=1 FL=1